MNFIAADINKIIYNLDLTDNEKFKCIINAVDRTIEDIRSEEYEYAKEDGYEKGWNEAKIEIEKDVQNPKKTIQDIFEAANYDDITLKELFREFKLQMKIKNLL